MTPPPTVSIRLMTSDDLDEVRRIEDAAYGTDAWTRRTLEDELINGFSSYVVAESSDGQIAGFAGVWFMRDQLHIVTVAVDPQLQRRGIASRLLLRCLELGQEAELPVAVLEVRESNTGAQALYQQFGFTRLGRLRRYYKDNDEDALVMETLPFDSELQTQRMERLTERYG